MPVRKVLVTRWAAPAAVLIGVLYVAARMAGVSASDLFVLGALGFVCGIVALYQSA